MLGFQILNRFNNLGVNKRNVLDSCQRFKCIEHRRTRTTHKNGSLTGNESAVRKFNRCGRSIGLMRQILGGGNAFSVCRCYTCVVEQKFKFVNFVIVLCSMLLVTLCGKVTANNLVL